MGESMSLRHQILACNRCPLHARCNHIVAGKGSGPIMFVGDFPSVEDDLMAEPFVGREGQYLIAALRNVNLDVTKCFLTMMVKCRPEEGVPKAEHIHTCKHWLWEEIKQVKPKVIVPLGKSPTLLLLKLKQSAKLKDVVGRFHDVEYLPCSIAPWYAPGWLMQQGNRMAMATARLLNQAKERIQ